MQCSKHKHGGVCESRLWGSLLRPFVDPEPLRVPLLLAFVVFLYWSVFSYFVSLCGDSETQCGSDLI